jgi:hypothetical protein
VQNKVWVQGPDIAWEIYTVLGDAPDMVCMPNGCSTTDQAEQGDELLTVGSGSSPCC